MTRRLLIVDDAAIIRKMIADTVESAGWEVAGEASDGEQAIELYQQLRPDAVTLDMVMPEHNGLHALKGIKEIDPEAKVVVVSALDQQNILKQAFKLGAVDFIVKPFDDDAVVATLNSAVDSALVATTAASASKQC